MPLIWGAQAASPVVVGSLPTTVNARQELRVKNVRGAFRQAAEKDRLAACAPQRSEVRSRRIFGSTVTGANVATAFA